MNDAYKEEIEKLKARLTEKDLNLNEFQDRMIDLEKECDYYKQENEKLKIQMERDKKK